MDATIVPFLTSLYNKYNDNEFCKKNLTIYLKNAEAYVIQQRKEHYELEKRKELFEYHKKRFIKHFMKEFHYFYIPDANFYIEYDNNTYKIVTEDCILGNILTKINNEKFLVPCKQKISGELLIRIREQLLIKTIPESRTIQTILKIISTSVAPNKDFAKYFLTIIGDVLLKKNNDCIYLTDPKINKFIEIFQYHLNKYCKCNISNIFKTKYHNYAYENIRIVTLNENVGEIFLWEYLIKRNILSIIAVASHYSKRYKSADNYIHNLCSNTNVKQQVFYLKNNTKEQIVQTFSDTSLQSSDTLTITNKEICYVWKEYLKKEKLPNIMFLKNLYEILEKKYTYNKSRQTFLNITSKSLDYIKHFNTFISENITFISTSDGQSNIIDTFETSELLELFNIWLKQKDIQISMNEERLIQLIQHFYENVKIVNNNLILGCISTLWNKENTVQTFLHTMINDNTTDISNNLYELYCANNSNTNIHMKVSKTYFNYMLNLQLA